MKGEDRKYTEEWLKLKPSKVVHKITFNENKAQLHQTQMIKTEITCPEIN